MQQQFFHHVAKVFPSKYLFLFRKFCLLWITMKPITIILWKWIVIDHWLPPPQVYLFRILKSCLKELVSIVVLQFVVVEFLKRKKERKTRMKRFLFFVYVINVTWQINGNIFHFDWIIVIIIIIVIIVIIVWSLFWERINWENGISRFNRRHR